MPLFCFDAGGSVLRAYGGGVRPDCLCAYGFAHFGTLPFFRNATVESENVAASVDWVTVRRVDRQVLPTARADERDLG